MQNQFTNYEFYYNGIDRDTTHNTRYMRRSAIASGGGGASPHFY